MISACSNGSSGTFLPRGSRPVAEPEVCAAFRLIRTRSLGRFLFATISAVIILVRLAIGCSRRGCSLPEHLSGLHVEEDTRQRGVLERVVNGQRPGQWQKREACVDRERRASRCPAR